MSMFNVKYVSKIGKSYIFVSGKLRDFFSFEFEM